MTQISAPPGRLFLIAGFALGLGIFGVGLGSWDGEPLSRPLVPGAAYNDPTSGVCEGVVSSIREQKAKSRFPLLVPNHALANRDNVTSARDCLGETVALEFESGVSVYLSFNDLADPRAEWASMAETYPEFSVRTVRGVPASVVDVIDGDGTARGGVELVEDGVRITVAGNHQLPLSELIAITESLQADR